MKKKLLIILFSFVLTSFLPLYGETDQTTYYFGLNFSVYTDPLPACNDRYVYFQSLHPDACGWSGSNYEPTYGSCTWSYNPSCSSTKLYDGSFVSRMTCTGTKVPKYVYTYGYAHYTCEEPETYYLSPVDINPNTNSNEGDSPNNTCAPINIASGNKYRSEVDLEPSGSSPIKLTRFYNSLSSRRGKLGEGWRHTYSSSLYPALPQASQENQATPFLSPVVLGDATDSQKFSSEQAACESGWGQISGQYSNSVVRSASASYENGSCNLSSAAGFLGSIPIQSTAHDIRFSVFNYRELLRPNGARLRFNFGDADNYIPASNVNGTLENTAEEGYRYTDANGTVEIYNKYGKLISITTRDGVKQTLSYDANTFELKSVVDSYGNTLSFHYNAETKKLASVTLPNQQTVSYTQDVKNNLTSVKREDESTRLYHYEDIRFVHALTGITDENNQRHMTFAYDDIGRAITSELAGGVNKVNIDFINENTSIMTDALGESRTYRFTTINRVKNIVDVEGENCGTCGGKASHKGYDENGYVNSITDFNGNVTSITNNTRGLATHITEAVGTKDERMTDYVWHATLALPTCIIENVKTTHLSYTTQGLLETRTTFDTSDVTLFATPESKRCTTILARSDYGALNKRSIGYTYFPDYGLVKTIDGARTDINDVTSFTYDALGNLATITNALGHVTKLNNYTLRGKPQEIIDANGLVTTLTYDVRGQIDVVKVGNLITDYDFDAVGNLDLVTRADGSFIDYDYDAAHRLTDIRDQTGGHIHYTLDLLGNREGTEIKDKDGNLKRTSTAIYNQLGQLEKTVGAANQTTDYLLYDNNGNLKHLRDADSKDSYFGYDALNRLETTTNALNDTSTTTYDAQDNVTSVTDLRGLVTQYKYDGLGNRIEQISPDTKTTQYTSHDGNGNVLTMVDASLQITTYIYDALNRLDAVTYADGSTVDYIYDAGINALGRLSSIAYANITGTQTGSSAWSYDIYGRTLSKTETINTVALTTTYQYHASTGQLTNMTTTGGHAVAYSYLNGKLNSINVDNQSILSAMTYDPFGPATSWLWGNGALSQRNYNQDGQLDTYTLGNNIHDINYTLSGNVQNITNLTTATVPQTFNYDDLHRLKEYNNVTGNKSYNYDANSNRIGLTDIATTQSDTYVIDPVSNKLTSITGMTNATYGYNANGNITHDGIHSFEYDASNRLVSVDAGQAIYQLNALGQRVQKTLTPLGNNNGDGTFDRTDINSLRKYIRQGGSYVAGYDCNQDKVLYKDDLRCLRERIQYQNKNPDAPVDNGITLYVYNEEGQLVAEHTDTGIAKQEVIYFGNMPVAVLENNLMNYIHTDHLGTPRMITNNTNIPVWTWESDPFGTTSANSDPDGDGIDVVFNHRFAGQYYDWETGLHYNYFRDYEPSTGRYVQSDPIGLAGGLNTYSYVGGNPVRYGDPSGLLSVIIGGTANSTPIKGYSGTGGFYITGGGNNGNAGAGFVGTESKTTGLNAGAGVVIDILSGGIENIEGKSTTDSVCLGPACINLHKDVNGDIIGGGLVIGPGLPGGFSHGENNSVTTGFEFGGNSCE